MKTKLIILALAFIALISGLELAAFVLCILILVLMIGDAVELPECVGTCQQAHRPCDCRAPVNTKE